MTVAVTAGVYSTERDASLYAQQLSTANLGLGNTFTKGPVNQRTFISSEDSLTAIFGKPTPNSQGWYAAREYLRRGNQLWVVRVGADANLEYAEVDALDNASAATMTFTAITKGSDFNGFTLVLTAGTSTGRKITIEDADGIPVEAFDNITKANCAANINGISKYLTVTNITSGSPGEPINQEVSLAGGSDGIIGLGDSDIVGTTTGAVRTGLKLFANPEAVDINLLCSPGFASTNVNLEMLQLCEARADALALIDPPYGLNHQEVTDWHNGLSPGDYAYNSSYGALYWAWQQVFDENNRADIWTAPSGHAARVMAENDAVAFEWFAPAGSTRGRVKSSKSTEQSPDLGERNLLYGPGNNVNPIVDFVNDGIMVYGQKTLQRTASALDRINVRRMLLSIRKVVASVARPLVFEPGDQITRRQFIATVTPPLRRIATNRGLRDFLVVCDDSNNPASLQDQNRMAGKIFLKPVKTTEIIEVGFITTSQGANFTELVTSF